MKIEIIKAVQAAGFDVYMLDGNVDKYTWCFYSDPATKAIGYLQKTYFGDGVDISTVHVPSAKVGSGSNVLQNVAVTPANLRQGLAHVARWWKGDPSQVRKYRDIEHWRSANPHNGSHVLVPPL